MALVGKIFFPTIGLAFFRVEVRKRFSPMALVQNMFFFRGGKGGWKHWLGILAFGTKWNAGAKRYGIFFFCSDGIGRGNVFPYHWLGNRAWNNKV